MATEIKVPVLPESVSDATISVRRSDGGSPEPKVLRPAVSDQRVGRV